MYRWRSNLISVGSAIYSVYTSHSHFKDMFSIALTSMRWLTNSGVNCHLTHAEDSFTKHLHWHVSPWDWWIALNSQGLPLTNSPHSVVASWILKVVLVHADSHVEIRQSLEVIMAVHNHYIYEWNRIMIPYFKQTCSNTWLPLSAMSHVQLVRERHLMISGTAIIHVDHHSKLLSVHLKADNQDVNWYE